MSKIQHVFRIVSTEGVEAIATINGIEEEMAAKTKAVRETLKKNPDIRIHDPKLIRAVFLAPAPPQRSNTPPKKTPR